MQRSVPFDDGRLIDRQIGEATSSLGSHALRPNEERSTLLDFAEEAARIGSVVTMWTIIATGNPIPLKRFEALSFVGATSAPDALVGLIEPFVRGLQHWVGANRCLVASQSLGAIDGMSRKRRANDSEETRNRQVLAH